MALPPMPCPTTPTPYDDRPDEMMTGCGSTNTFIDASEGDGLVECECGMWFDPAEEYGEDWREKYYVPTLHRDTGVLS